MLTMACLPQHRTISKNHWQDGKGRGRTLRRTPDPDTWNSMKRRNGQRGCNGVVVVISGVLKADPKRDLVCGIQV